MRIRHRPVFKKTTTAREIAMKKNPLLILIAIVAVAVAFVFIEARADETPDARPAIIFVPGYFGSYLVDKQTKQTVFIDTKSAMSPRGALSFAQAELQTPPGPEVEAGGVLEYVNVLKSYKIDVYGSEVDRLRAIPGHQVIPYGYDWRDDLHKAVVGLDALVRKLKAQGVPRIDIVSHSLGSLISAYYVAYGAQDPATAKLDWSGARAINHLVISGAPFDGAMIFVEQMGRGNTLPLMGRLMPAETMSSFPSAYFALPYRTGYVFDRDKAVRKISLEKPEFWRDNRLGLAANQDLPPKVKAARNSYVTKWIDRARKFMGLLQLPEAAKVPVPRELKVQAILGHGTPTLAAGYALEDQGRIKLLFKRDNLGDFGLDAAGLETDGDGTVTNESAALPAPLAKAATIVATKAAHDKLLIDRDVQEKIVQFLAK